MFYTALNLKLLSLAVCLPGKESLFEQPTKAMAIPWPKAQSMRDGKSEEETQQTTCWRHDQRFASAFVTEGVRCNTDQPTSYKNLHTPSSPEFVPSDV
ncbi:uncharacterized protein SPSK_02072 [Sporothrix schenckii 1099-18]|uniref:Secreted protein n=1 Tax=Sporothrix schenckii 1099-18 TaxID=1397361 RepID=A0A0F2MH16_SPOSC|nr:uncharacterized protein SPSK_02072 [Sporothrix schenckii 1099-18]KJR87441.1 hypothetical protein SPSK_02072 [Sporothrix schenckii 1099-18]